MAQPGLAEEDIRIMAKRYVVQQFAKSVFSRGEHGVDFGKTTYEELKAPTYDKLGGGTHTPDLQEAQVYGWRKKPVFNPRIERIIPVRIAPEE